MPIILATWKAEIRRTAIQSQPRQPVCKTLSQKYPTHTKKKTADGPAQVIKCLPGKSEPEFKSQYCQKKKKIFGEMRVQLEKVYCITSGQDEN
jgi:hypothetical protein